jgi:hypothetical protein
MKIRFILFVTMITMITASCDRCKDDPAPAEPKLIIKITTDPSQERLNNLGQPSVIPAGHAAQSPVCKKISAHYLEFTPDMYTALGAGEVVYHAPETTAGGANAIDFSKAKVVAPGEVFFEMPLKDFSPGTYEWVRASLLYQNGDVQFTASGLDLVGRLACFVGFNTYISNYTINTQSVTVNDDQLQGYWGFETTVLGIPYVTSGQAPAGAVTVPNPLFATSPIPQGSCVVTGSFAQPLVITGNETQDVVVTLSLSTNQSFEWVDSNANGKWEPQSNEQVVDMGFRGLIPYWE